MEGSRLQGPAGMDGDDELPAGHLGMAQSHVTSRLMVFVPPHAPERSHQAIPGNVPGKLRQAATSTVASSIAPSVGIGSPCLRQLSR